jgi:hypothetical protein
MAIAIADKSKCSHVGREYVGEEVFAFGKEKQEAVSSPCLSSDRGSFGANCCSRSSFCIVLTVVGVSFGIAIKMELLCEVGRTLLITQKEKTQKKTSQEDVCL